MTGQPPHTVTAARAARRADAHAVRLSQRDIDGLLLCGEHYGAPYDLLAAALQVRPDRLAAIVAWCWLTRDGMIATGLGFPATRPALARLAHIRAVLAVRIWLASGQVWRDGRAWWHSERRLRAVRRPDGTGHVADAEIHWPSIEHSPLGGDPRGSRTPGRGPGQARGPGSARHRLRPGVTAMSV